LKKQDLALIYSDYAPASDLGNSIQCRLVKGKKEN